MSLPNPAQRSYLGTAVGIGDGQLIIDGGGEYEVRHRHGAILSDNLYGRLVDKQVDHHRVSFHIQRGLHRWDGEAAVEVGPTCCCGAMNR